MHMNLPETDFDSRYVMVCEDAWDYQMCLYCVLESHHVPDFPCHLSGKRMCVESMSLVITPDTHAFNVFISICVCVKRAYVPVCFCIGQPCAIAISGLSSRLACPATARTSAQLACFSVLAFESQSLLTGSHLHPVFVIGFPETPVFVDWFVQQLPDPLPD